MTPRAGLLVALAGALAACQPPAPAVGPLPPIRIGYSAVSPETSPLWVAHETGMLRKRGLDVTEVGLFQGGARTAQALATGEIQVALVSASAVVTAVAAGADLVLVAGLDNALKFDLVVRPGIATAGDLQGKRLGVSGSAGSSVTALRYALREVLRLDPDRDTTLVSIGDEEKRLAALEARQIDGTVLSPALTPRAKKVGLVVLVRLAERAVAGYSFGSAVGATVAAHDPRVRFYLGIAPPLNRYDLAVLRQARCRIAFIAGRHDELCDPVRLEALAASLPARPWLRLLDTDHFFGGALDDLAAACREALAWVPAPTTEADPH